MGRRLSSGNARDGAKTRHPPTFARQRPSTAGQMTEEMLRRGERREAAAGARRSDAEAITVRMNTNDVAARTLTVEHSFANDREGTQHEATRVSRTEPGGRRTGARRRVHVRRWPIDRAGRHERARGDVPRGSDRRR